MEAPATRFEYRPPSRWMVVHTMSRAEKQVHAWCERLGILSYLPLRRSVRRYARRVATHMVPIFSGYVFIQMDPLDKHLVEESKHAASVLVPDEKMELQLIQELRALYLLEQATEAGELVVRPEIVPGQSVVLKSGPFAGINGIVVHRRHQARLAVNIEMIGQSVSVEVDVGEVEMEW